ncbi:DUF5776 domain-containing protein, partial [Apilactobacillus xinyiensis]|uniref:DUF5776 domain-containing protein n=1 Tax=Apilactobacillus xinyiensis TaxID=2841032 RepID=UPI00200E771E
KQYVPGTTSINDQQSAADAAMDAEVKATKASIASDSRLDTAARSAQDSNVDSAATVAKGNINKATDAQGIEDAQSAGKTDIDKQYVPGTSLDSQQHDVDSKIDAEVAKVDSEIANDNNLYSDDKDKQKAAVINAANAAKSIINGAKNAQAILDEIPVGITNIDKAYQPGKPHADYVPFNVPTSYNAVKDFDDGIQRNDTSIVYDQNYKNVHSGFNDGIHRLKAEDKASKVYMDGYKMAVDGLAGMKAAKSIDKVDINELSGKSADFNAGFNGYLAGLKAAIKHFEKADTGQGPVYKFTYDEGYKAGQKQAMKQASLAGRKQAKSGKKIPSLKGYSKQYAKAYKQAFNEANKNTDKSYNVISENGIYIHSSAKFSKDNRVRKLKKGAKFSVKRVVKVNGVNRYYISDKEYVTSDPNMVSNQ